MTYFWYGVLGLIGWAALFTIICVWSRKDTWGRTIAMLLFAASIVWIPLVFSQTLGNPRPLSWEKVKQFGDIERKLLGFKLEYEKAIYIYIDGPTPLSLVLPWRTETAEGLQGMAKKAAEEEGEVMVRIRPYEESLEDIIQFYNAPQQKFLPEKPQDGGEFLERE